MINFRKVLVAALIVAGSTSAHASLGWNGFTLNGFTLNGFTLNGLKPGNSLASLRALAEQPLVQ